VGLPRKENCSGVQANRFTPDRFHDALAKLKQLRSNPEDIRHVPKVLAEGGVRLVLIESLPKGKIDGACFWLNEFSPVIAMSMRYDRIDHFGTSLRMNPVTSKTKMRLTASRY